MQGHIVVDPHFVELRDRIRIEYGATPRAAAIWSEKR